MNKRQSKKKIKNVSKFAALEDVYDKCMKCRNYEYGDSSVGLNDGCIADYLYNIDGDFIEEKNDLAIFHIENKGYLCPYFALLQTKKMFKDNLPKSHREYKKRKIKQDLYFKEMANK